MLKVWGRSTSSNVQKVVWCCDEIGLPYERIDAGGSFGRVNDPDYRAMNPNGRVPTIVDDGFVLWESNTICRYLSAKHGATTVYPTALQARADTERWMDWASTTLGPALHQAFWGLIRTPAAQQDHAAIRTSAEAAAAALSIVDARVADRAFLCGDALTLGDIATGVHAYRWLHLPFDRVGYERPAVPNLRRWHDRLAERAPFRKWVMIEIV